MFFYGKIMVKILFISFAFLGHSFLVYVILNVVSIYVFLEVSFRYFKKNTLNC